MAVDFFRHDALHNNFGETQANRTFTDISGDSLPKRYDHRLWKIRRTYVNFIRQQDGNKAILDPTHLVGKPQKTTVKCGDPDRIRTCDRRIRNPMLYPAELRGHDSPR